MAVNYRAGDEPIEGFRLQHFLGNGTFGAVWKASAPGGAEVAIKFIDLSNANGFRELKALQLIKRLRHPNIVPLMGYWLKDEAGQVLDQDQLADSQVFETLRATSTISDSSAAVELIVVMGLGDQSLSDRLGEVREEGEHGIAPVELLKYMEDVARAIDFLNGHVQPGSDVQDRLSIQHCDIKPQNILLVGGAAQLCDLGLARMSGDTRKTRMAFTAAYGAPECFQGTTPSSSTDQYSLAISYVELRTGELPFEDLSSPASVIQQHLASQLDLTRLGEQERLVVRRATNQDPDQRYPTALAFVTDLRAAIEGRMPIQPPKQKHRRSAWLAGLTLAAIATLAAVFTMVPEAKQLGGQWLAKLEQAWTAEDSEKDDVDLQQQRDPSADTSLNRQDEPIRQAEDNHQLDEDSNEVAPSQVEAITEGPTEPTGDTDESVTIEVTQSAASDTIDAVTPPIEKVDQPPANLDGRWVGEKLHGLFPSTNVPYQNLIHFVGKKPFRVDVKAARRLASVAEANLAAVALKDSDLKRAEKHVRRALELDGQVAQAQLQAGRLMARFDKLSNAIERYTQAIQADPELQSAYRLRGITYAIQGEVARAHPDLTEALRLDPQDRTALRIRALVRLELGRYDSAVQDRIRLTSIPGRSTNVILPLQLIRETEVNTDEGKVKLPPNYPLTLLTSSRKRLTVEFIYDQQRHTAELPVSSVRPNSKL